MLNGGSMVWGFCVYFVYMIPLETDVLRKHRFQKCDNIRNQEIARGLAPCLAIKCGWTCTVNEMLCCCKNKICETHLTRLSLTILKRWKTIQKYEKTLL